MGPLYAPGDGLKHVTRKIADDRCVRCGHPYVAGAGEWSPCDERCTHEGPLRWLTTEGYREPDPAVARRMIYDHGANIDARWRILTVHHLDGDKANCRWWNLAALCQRCHLQIQGKVQMARVWPWEHSEWMKPYAAGFYAHSYLGQDLSRIEVVERLDELLGLERLA
jgi:hypothetical protein